ncbi:2-hydroxyacid dehydrogenase [Granulicella sp. dw_53]|uniref:2-hydroxyacid dehydrogenase n=1 Tax=Granulicella sp. dw_53 TaxID=2719792 RepID=UPI001BD48973|nr:2-hydroxyacid dehydrogenase [Granulicella sp. dw_53]
MVRMGVEDFIDDSLLQDLPKEIELVRIPADLQGEIEVEFWLSCLSSADSRRLWPHLKGVKVVQAHSAGVDSLKKIVPSTATLCDARGVHNIPTAEWAVTAVLAMQKNLPFFFGLQQRADWKAKDEAEQTFLLAPGSTPNPHIPHLIDEIADKTILIVGYGAIGEAIEARLSAFGPRFLRVARSPKPGVEPVSNLDQLLPHADIVILITPLTSETHHLIDAGRLAKLKPGALLVNAGRGAVVDTDALLAALHAKKLRAAMDVTDPEPLPPDHPLWKAPNLLITPHVATDSPTYLKRVLKFVSQQATRYVQGEPLQNIVTGEY